MKDTSEFRKRFLQDALLVTLIFCLITVLSYVGIFDYINWKLFDVLVTLYRETPVHRDNVVIVCIDQKSIDFFDKNNDITWPWPREFHGRLVRYLTECGAKAIVFDVIFSEQDIDRTHSKGDASDDTFAAAIEESGITYLVAAGQDEYLPRNSYDDVSLFIEDIESFHRFTHTPVYQSMLLPIQKFSQGVRHLGLANLDPEADGIHRRYPLVAKIGDHYIPSLGFAVVRDILDKDALNHLIINRISNGTIFDDEGKFLINWYGKGGTGRGGTDTDAVFNYYSYHAVIASSIQEEKGDTPVLPRDTFKDKIVLIGSNAPGLLDLKSTPFTHMNLYPGMEIHATAMENMLTGEFIHHIPSWALFLYMVLITMVLFGIDKIFKNLRIFIGVYVILIVCELAVSYFYGILYDLWISSGEILGTTTFVFTGLLISGYFRETKEKRVLRGHFGRYVNDSVLKEILANPTSVDFKGRTLTATIMATDIAGFTSISEQLPPYEVVARLNDYLSEVSETLIDNGAFINKYIGDAILALYGAFEEPEHMKKACLAAIYAQKIIARKIEQAQSDNIIPFITRIGITTGEMTLGNIGSARKIEYTVIGDTVNTAFRLEGLNKFYKTTIIVSEHTKNGAGDDFEFRLLDILCVKGKEKSEQVFELLGIKGEVNAEKLRWRDEFQEALTLYQQRNFMEARNIFARLNDEGDHTSDVFKMRCEEFIINPPPPEWNGVWVMQRK